jgi:hypothetical protein
MPTIGYDSTTDLGGINLVTTDVHLIMDTYLTHTPGSAENLTLVGFHTDGAGGNGTLEIGVYRVDTLARIATANVSNTGSGRFTAAISGALSSGVEYCVGMRVVSDTASYRAYYEPTPTHLSALTGSSALADPFSTAGGGINQRYAIFAITEAAGGGGNSNLFGGKLAGLLGGKL